jgi:phage shock protein E
VEEILETEDGFMKKTFPILAAIFGLTVALSTTLAGDHTKDTPQDVKKAVADDKAVLIDVREKGEWDAGHLKVARLIPLSELEAGIKPEDIAKKLPKGKVVYCHCAAGGRSLDAADALKKLGYDARPLKPGYKDLLKAGFEAAPR